MARRRRQTPRKSGVASPEAWDEELTPEDLAQRPPEDVASGAKARGA
jgi:hypothetical protein